jgi:hypothetical protein
MVRVDITEDDEGNLLSSKTFAEISDIILAGNIPYCVYREYVFTLSKSSKMSEISTYVVAANTCRFTSIEVMGATSVYLKEIKIEDAGEMQIYYNEYLIACTDANA